MPPVFTVMSTVGLLDTVALVTDCPELGLVAGEVGAVVEVLGGGTAFEVEFLDGEGHTYGLHTLRANQLVALHTRGQPLRAAGVAA